MPLSITCGDFGADAFHICVEFLVARMLARFEPFSQRDDDGRSYYELLVRRGGEITLARYRKENGDARRPISATTLNH